MSKDKRSLRTLDQAQLDDVTGASAGIGGFGPGGFRINNGSRRANNTSGGFDLGNLLGGFLQSNAGQNLVNRLFDSLNKLFA